MASEYVVSTDHVEYRHDATQRAVLTDADVATFAPLLDVTIPADISLPPRAAKDRSAVWFMDTRIEGADPVTFRFFWGGQSYWGVDKNCIYWFYYRRKPQIKIINSGDPKSFHFLDEPFGAYSRIYALDDKHVYCAGHIVRGADPATFRNVPKDRPIPSTPSGRSDTETKSDFYRDDQSIFLYGRKLKEIDAPTFILFQYSGWGNNLYAIDKHQAYCMFAAPPDLPVSGSYFGILLAEHYETGTRFQQVREYIASRSDLKGYWFSREGS